ncbi:MAG: hypothetical protein ABI603_03805, partial [Acidobacteriota bacterium]
MKRVIVSGLIAATGLAAGALPALQAREVRQGNGAEKALVYADFERTEGGRPVSARGGMIQMFGYEESGVHKSTFKG